MPKRNRKEYYQAHADYVLALKENHPTVYDEVKVYFGSALNEPHFYGDVQKAKTLEKGHGRIEERVYYLTNEIDWMEDKAQWSGLKAIGEWCFPALLSLFSGSNIFCRRMRKRSPLASSPGGMRLFSLQGNARTVAACSCFRLLDPLPAPCGFRESACPNLLAAMIFDVDHTL